MDSQDYKSGREDAIREVVSALNSKSEKFARKAETAEKRQVWINKLKAEIYCSLAKDIARHLASSHADQVVN